MMNSTGSKAKAGRPILVIRRRKNEVCERSEGKETPALRLAVGHMKVDIL